MSELVAIVVLNPATGELSGDDIITAANVDDFLPAPGDLDSAMVWFTSAGFVVGGAGPISFSIAASEQVFADRFGEAFVAGEDLADLAALPAALDGVIAAIEFDEPPAFGPGNP